MLNLLYRNFQMSREARLVLGPQPFPTKVLVVGGGLHKALLDKVLECLEGCNVTLDIEEGDHEEITNADLGAVMVLGSSIPTAAQIQKHSTASAFLYCAQVMPTDEIVSESTFVFRGTRWQVCTVALGWVRWSSAPGVTTRWSPWLRCPLEDSEEVYW